MFPKRFILSGGIVAGLFALALPLGAQPAPAAPATDFDAPLPAEEIERRLGYATGYAFGRQVGERLPLQIDPKYLEEGLRAGMQGADSRYTEDQLRHAQIQLMTLMSERQQQLAAERFAALDVQDGVQKTASGVYYEIVQPGTGASPAVTDTVVAHYTGRLLDGTVFDSSRERGQPARFPLNGVIRGWQEILPMMKTGGRWRVVIPYESAYGDQGRPPTIPPRAALEFDIELVSIEAAN